MVTKVYELMFIINPELGEEPAHTLIERIQGYLEDAGATIFDFKNWGVRRLTYPIKGYREGRYFLTHFSMPAANINDVKRRMLLTEGVLRELITLFEGDLSTPPAEAEAPPEAEVAMVVAPPAFDEPEAESDAEDDTPSNE